MDGRVYKKLGSAKCGSSVLKWDADEGQHAVGMGAPHEPRASKGDWQE